MRASLAAAAVAAALLAAAWGGSPADAAPRGGSATSGYLYWSNATASDPGKGTIGRARLDGTDVNQKFIKVPDANILLGVAVDPAADPARGTLTGLRT